jgi:hypothetical protein
MIFIDEKTIDWAVDLVLDSEDHDDELWQTMEEQQPGVLAYLLDEEQNAFTEAEKEYLLNLLMIMWAAIRKKDAVPASPIDPQILADAEERNWEKLEAQGSTKFKERIDVFFESTDQEDLLAFLEDAMHEDEESPVTKEGREPMFVLLKSVLDCF